MRTWVVAGVLLLATTWAVGARAENLAGACQELAPPQAPVREPIDATSFQHGKQWESAPLGVGILRPIPPAPSVWAEWLSGVMLPLFDRPGEQADRWLARGWLIEPAAPGAGREAPTFRMVETEYESLSFAVLEMRADGWFRFRMTGGEGGAPWSHRDHLSLGEVELRFEPWEEVFRRIDVLFFRTEEPPYALREAPGKDAALLTSIGREHQIEPLEFRGDWLKARVYQPDRLCREEWDGEEAVGWLRWRRPPEGPLLFYPYRGC